MFDFVVVGGGMAGASAAYELADGASVLLLEREGHCGYHTTGRSAALFSETYGNATIRSLTRASRGLYETPPAGFAEHPLLTPRNVLFIARADQEESMFRMVEIFAQTGEKPSLALDTDAVCKRVPIMRADYVAQALLDETSMDIDVHGLHQGYLRGARSRGARIAVSAEVVDVDRGPYGWRVSTNNGQFEARTIVNAAGAWADAIAAMAGVATAGLTPLRRTAMMLDLPEGVDGSSWPLVIDVDEEFYFKPDAGRLLASPADETPSAPCDAQADEFDVAVAIDRIQQAADLPVRSISRRWAGLRTFAADRSPVVGFDPRCEDFFWLAGQGGYGIQTAPALAKVAAALARRRTVADEILETGFDPDAVSPARAGLGSASHVSVA
ncbi:FAD-dependent oxidoreductase [Mesorhizobium erdmanii]|uniref:FAD-dependent oxidoreductase n=2 Tax=Mesorhizobium TaxID=68287 RepID=A0A3M9X2W4_9HYPH|nr:MULTISPECIES: FAD-binding oxidoreductase [Mesorhizobium]RNJ42195.1 FAD-dependent oxidoreductase [Mesorhizobium japonicum]RXT39122.1 FAD-dependent oxidoreductase [Mesorhizobium erdmanii]